MSTLCWSLREAASWLKNMWHWPELDTVPPPDVRFCHGRSGNEENIKESRVILVMSHVVLTWTWCITIQVRSTECVGFCQRLCLVVRVDLMFVTAGNDTDHAHKIWQARLLAWNTFPQVMLEFNRWNKRIWKHGCRICQQLVVVHISALATGLSGNDAQRTSLLMCSTITKTPFSPHIMLWHWKSIFQVPF